MNKAEIKQREEAFERSYGRCAVCNKPLMNSGQYAHKIANKKMWREKYGSFIIDNERNGEYVCDLSCNASVDVGSSIGRHLEVIIDIVIAEAFKLWRKDGLDKITDKLLAEYRKQGYMK